VLLCSGFQTVKLETVCFGALPGCTFVLGALANIVHVPPFNIQIYHIFLQKSSSGKPINELYFVLLLETCNSSIFKKIFLLHKHIE
jgi:hypothetical protein